MIKRKRTPTRKALKPKPRTKPTTSKAVALVKHQSNGTTTSTTLSLANPQQVMEFGKILKHYIKENNLSVNIGGKEYAMVDGWKFALMNFGLTAIPQKPVVKHLPGQYVTTLYSRIEIKPKNKPAFEKEVAVFVGFTHDQEIIQIMRGQHKISREFTRPYFAYECEVDVVKLSDHVPVSYGEGFCSNLEMLKSGFDEYSVNSMSQTRGIGKAARNLLGFVMNSAGLESTPAEEMDEVERFNNEINDYKSKEPSKPKADDKAFKAMMQRALKGEEVLSKAKEHFTLTQEQIEALEIAEKHNVKQKPEQK